MQEVKAGSEDAFGELYDRFSARAYRIARSVCHDQGGAEEAVQELFVSIWNSRNSYEPQRGSVAAWLLTIARYRAIDVARRNTNHSSRRAHEEELESLSAPGDVADRAVARTETHQMQALLSRLPDAQREVVTLAFYGQLTHIEIASQLKLPQGTVKGRMRLALHKLRDELAA